MASYSPRKDKNGEIVSYQIKVSRGRDKVTGKQLTPYTTTYTPHKGWSKKAIERDLHKFMGTFEESCKRGEVLTNEQKKQLILQEHEHSEQRKSEEARKITFDKYVEVFLNEKVVEYSTGTLENYTNILKKASVAFGGIKMEDIDFLKVKQYITDIQTNGRNTFSNKPLSHGTVIKYYIVLHAFFQNAVENKVISQSPMQNMKRPKARKDEASKKALVYTEIEIQKIIECLNLESLKWKALIMFMIDSGCRRGEVAALRWEDIDFTTGKVNICKNGQYTPGKGTYINSPKNGKSRVIYLTPVALEVMKEWRMEQRLLHFGQGIQDTGFCFTKANGDMINPQEPTAYLRRFGKKYNLPGIHPHALRHTMATLSIVNGADIVSVSKKLGHSNTSVTLDIYSHANEEAQQRANAILANAIYCIKQA